MAPLVLAAAKVKDGFVKSADAVDRQKRRERRRVLSRRVKKSFEAALVFMSIFLALMTAGKENPIKSFLGAMFSWQSLVAIVGATALGTWYWSIVEKPQDRN